MTISWSLGGSEGMSHQTTNGVPAGTSSGRSPNALCFTFLVNGSAMPSPSALTHRGAEQLSCPKQIRLLVAIRETIEMVLDQG